MRLTYSTEISEKRNMGKVAVSQSIEVVAEFEPCKRLDVEAVNLYQDGKKIAEISHLLDSAKGDPLTAIIEAVDWDSLYAEHSTERQQMMADTFRENGY